jgi:glycolate oxidase FAD binding subunit
MAPTGKLLEVPVEARSFVRPAQAVDAIDGVLPRCVADPPTAEDLAAVLAWASAERLAVVIRGGGTKLGWGRRPSAVDIVLSTRRLNRIVAHEHADLTATTQAGGTLADVNRELARHGQFLPLETAFETATIGGAIATNDSGPRRHRYGTPRDVLIGVRLATADGRLVKAGGNVVKNVAGYDLCRLLSGSFGSLAAIVSATFKLSPLPHASSTVTAGFDEAAAAAAAVATMRSSQLDPAALDFRASTVGGSDSGRPRYVLLVRFASAPAATAAQVEQAQTMLRGAWTAIVTGSSEAALWQEHGSAVWTAPGAVVKVTWSPASTEGVLAILDELGRGGTPVELVARATGTGLVALGGDSGTQIRSVEFLRARRDLLRHVTLLRASQEVKARVDVWDSLGDAGVVGEAVKRAFDPAGILNAGRGPV